MSKADLNMLCEQVAVPPEQLRYLLDEVKRYIPEATVWAFGSRVDGTHRPTSDLDLAVHCGKATARKDLPRLNEALVESDLPFKVQLLDFDRLPENMHKNIKAKYVELYSPREEASESELPQTVTCSVTANGVGVKDILIQAEFGVSYKNPYNIAIGPTDLDGNAQITRQHIIEKANKELNFSIMDFKPIQDFFSGIITVRIMNKDDIEKALEVYKVFQENYAYKSGYEESLNKAIKQLDEFKKNKLKLNAFAEPSGIKLIIR